MDLSRGGRDDLAYSQTAGKNCGRYCTNWLPITLQKLPTKSHAAWVTTSWSSSSSGASPRNSSDAWHGALFINNSCVKLRQSFATGNSANGPQSSITDWIPSQAFATVDLSSSFVKPINSVSTAETIAVVCSLIGLGLDVSPFVH